VLDWLGDQADALWYWVVVSLFLALAAWETVRPARIDRGLAVQRWLSNIGVYALNALLLAMLAPDSFINAWLGGATSPSRPFAVLDRLAGDWVVMIAGVLVLDLQAYLLHRMQHSSFLLWRLHSVHHADTDMDASTALRHHPGEFIVSSCIGATILAVLGLPAWVLAIYALLAIVVALFQHANAQIPDALDRLLRWVLVTPALHQVHHSVNAEEYNANFGTVFSVWDRLFGSYRHNSAGHEVSAFGVEPFTASRYAQPYWTLLLPFVVSRPHAPERAEDTLEDRI
jgi:sterol desaturase/sphingolipid hydroxylase (fatty acid hydroxylase superfamily)